MNKLLAALTLAAFATTGAFASTDAKPAAAAAKPAEAAASGAHLDDSPGLVPGGLLCARQSLSAPNASQRSAKGCHLVPNAVAKRPSGRHDEHQP